MLTRKPAVANTFYNGNPQQLSQEINNYLAQGQNVKVEGMIKGIIAPHAGYIYSGIVAGSAYKQFLNLDLTKHWKIIIIGPSHRYPLKGASVGAYDLLETPLGLIKVSEIAKEMSKEIEFIPDADKFEHSLEVQLPFLQTVFKNFEVIPIVVGNIDIMSFVQFLKKYDDNDTLFVISTDLSHFLPYDIAVSTDQQTNKYILESDINGMANNGDACGIVGVLTSMILAKEMGWKTNFLDYKNSGDTAGTKDKVVGYTSFAYSIPIESNI